MAVNVKEERVVCYPFNHFVQIPEPQWMNDSSNFAEFLTNLNGKLMTLVVHHGELQFIGKKPAN
jgi:hypothetical protein